MQKNQTKLKELQQEHVELLRTLTRKEPVLVYAIWTYLNSSQFDLRNNEVFETTVNDFSKFFGISSLSYPKKKKTK